MNPSRETFRTADGVDLVLHRWSPENEDDPRSQRGTCVLVHGYAEHALRYAPFAQALLAVGIGVLGMDLRGHGASPGVRADVPSFEALAGDVAALLTQAKRERPALPVVLFGHSLGGAVALRVALDRQAELACLVLSAPFLRPTDPPSPLLLGVASVLARLFPTIPVQPLDAGLVSRDPAMVAAYRSDPQVYNGRVRARMGHEMVRAGPKLLARAPSLSLPLLVIHGDADGLADVAASRELAAAVASKDVSLDVVEGGYHELLNDLDRERTRRRVVAWIDQHVSAGAQAGSTR